MTPGIKLVTLFSGAPRLPNLLTKSEQFDHAIWVKTAVTVTANATTAPDGTLTADKLIATAANSVHVAEQNTIAVPGGVARLSVYAKQGEYTRFALRESTATGNWAVFDLASGAVLGSSGAGNIVVTPVANGFYRCSITVAAASVGLATHVVDASWVSGSPNSGGFFAGDGVKGIYLWGAMLNTGNVTARYRAAA